MMTVLAFLIHTWKGRHRLKSAQSNNLMQLSIKNSHWCSSDMNITKGVNHVIKWIQDLLYRRELQSDLLKLMKNMTGEVTSLGRTVSMLIGGHSITLPSYYLSFHSQRSAVSTPHQRSFFQTMDGAQCRDSQMVRMQRLGN